MQKEMASHLKKWERGKWSVYAYGYFGVVVRCVKELGEYSTPDPFL